MDKKETYFQVFAKIHLAIFRNDKAKCEESERQERCIL